MNFFDAQDNARRATRRLVIIYLLAAAAIVIGVALLTGVALFSFTQAGMGRSVASFAAEQAPIMIGTGVLTALFIAGATLYKTSSLASGGGRVAADMGGTLISSDVQDPLRRRLRNVVEEMSIASGVPVPDIYVLEAEGAINAFAAGYAPGDAAIAVTRGALEVLDREELQGVIGHEFSHVLNGDMRLNIRLMGILFGIMSLSLIGRMILRGTRRTAIMSSRRNNGAPVILVIGLGLTALGAIGVFMARVLKSGISRQREYLADASAVQFTRQPDGLANALKKIGGYSEHSYLTANDPEEISHMLFGSGARMSRLFATHPPLTERIQALDPDFSPSDYPSVAMRDQTVASDDGGKTGRASQLTTAMAAGTAAALGESIADMVANPDEAHVSYAEELRQSVPTELYDAAHSPELAYLLVVALILDQSGRSLERQRVLATERLGGRRTRLVTEFHVALMSAGPEYRLPLMEIAFPALKRRPQAQLDFLVDLAKRLIDIDERVDLYEYCYYRILVGNLQQAASPAQHRRSRSARGAIRSAAVDLLRIIAEHGNDDPKAQAAAFNAGVRHFGRWGRDFSFTHSDKASVDVLDTSLERLLALNSDGKQMLLEAITAVVSNDKQLTVTETELIRAICATLHCPLPPILVEKPLQRVQ